MQPAARAVDVLYFIFQEARTPQLNFQPGFIIAEVNRCTDLLLSSFSRN